MSRYLNPVDYDYGTQTFQTFRNCKIENKISPDFIIDKLGDERCNQYLKSGVNFELLFDFLMGKFKGTHAEGFKNSLLGLEFNLRMKKYLKEIGCINICEEVKVDGTSIDVVATFRGNEKPLKVILPNMREEKIIMDSGKHTFECKAVWMLQGEKPTRQVEQATNYYGNKKDYENEKCHVAVLADTIVPFELNYSVRLVKGSIIRVETITRADLEKEIEKMRIKLVN